MNIKPRLLKFAGVSLLALSSTLSAQHVDITVTNLSFANYFTPFILVAHNGSEQQQLFSVGQSAQSFFGLEAMAEDGDIGGLASRVEADGATTVKNPAVDSDNGIIVTPDGGGVLHFLAPGGSLNTSITPQYDQKYLSLTAMILPSNDAFVGLDSYPIPTEAGTYHVYLNAYDAGTEVNTELTSHIPSPPFLGLGSGGTGVASATEDDEQGKVHIHPSNLGDFDQSGGISDMNATTHRFNNPIALITLTVGDEHED